MNHAGANYEAASIKNGEKVNSIIQEFQKLINVDDRHFLDHFIFPNCLLMPNNNFGNPLTVSLGNQNITRFQ